MIITQPAHLQRYYGAILDPKERDIKRANLIREHLKSAIWGKPEI